MELGSIQPPSVSSIIPRKCLIQEHLKYGHFTKSLNTTLKRSHKVGSVSRNFKFVDYNVRAAGLLQRCTMSRTSQSVETVPNDIKDENLIFVAGATGKVGSRTARELLKLGFKVRAGVRSVQRAEALVKSVKEMKLNDTTQPIEKLELVECDLEKREQIRPALSDASVVICCIGASEKEVLDITGPYRIDFQATKNLIDAATVSKVKHFVLVTSLGTNKVGFPAAILNLFWGVLIWKRKAEEELIASGLPYTIVRPGGMERPTDSYKETHNITLSVEDTLFGGQVSNLQIAELLACMAKNRGLSYCKIVEVIAETTAPLIPMEELLAKIPSQRGRTYIEEPSSPNVPEPVSKSVNSESPSIPSEKHDNQSKQASARPLSPYTAYEDLKPPLSPTPKAPGRGSKEVTVLETAPEPTAADSEASINSVTLVESAAVEAKISRPLSPYAVYEDLKPPTSPTPTPSGPRERPSQSATGNGVATTKDVIVIEKNPPQNPSSNHSPYPAYDNFKPPASPSPTAPTVSVNNENNLTPAAKPQPLSPFTMYDDLKPPSSPRPSAPKI